MLLIIDRKAFWDFTVEQASWTVADVAKMQSVTGTWVKQVSTFSNSVLGAGPGPASQSIYTLCEGYRDVSIAFTAVIGTGANAQALITWDAATASGYAILRGEVGTVEIHRWDAGVDSRLIVFLTDPWLNDAQVLKATRIGATISVFQDDVLAGSFDDATYTFGAVGLASDVAALLRFMSMAIVDRPT